MKRFDVWEHYSERECWTCDLCGEEIESHEGKLIEHLRREHNIEVGE